jgi:hypothetical protein
MQGLEQIMSLLNNLPPEEMEDIMKDVDDLLSDNPFIPNPGKQTEAYFSKADILLYGGMPGGGKTGLLCGWAFNESKRSLIIRAHYSDLNGVIDNAKKILGTNEGFIGGTRPTYKNKDQIIYFEGLKTSDGIDTGKQGAARDSLLIDEAAQLNKNQFLPMLGWLRTTDKGRRVRAILATNPPLDSTGDWLVEFFAPWLDPTYPNPAKEGEIRWFILDGRDNSIEVEDGEPVEYEGEIKFPMSRTFISASVEDNPYLDPVEYMKQLDALPAHMRNILKTGSFLHAKHDQDNQVIPTKWLFAAIDRWKERPQPPAGVPMCAIACDIAIGGKDKNVLAARYDYWFDELKEKYGTDTPLARDVAAFILSHRRNKAKIVLDMGGGYGSGVKECLMDNLESPDMLIEYKGAESASVRTSDGGLAFVNTRSAAYWKFREALDPSQPGGSPIMLPHNKRLITQLTLPTFTVSSRGIQITPKEEVVKKLGHSPDEADAVVMCWFQGQRGITPQSNWKSYNKSFAPAKVNLAYSNRR